jgi:SpoVK/Ycf46/Vps4 family AAA+-type ATPase
VIVVFIGAANIVFDNKVAPAIVKALFCKNSLRVIVDMASRLKVQFNDFELTKLTRLLSNKNVSTLQDMEFSAYHMTTQKHWADIVLNPTTLQQVTALKDWVKRHQVEIIDKSKKLSSGYRVLFYGPPGTGKSFTAAILGNELNIPVYRVDLSMVLSKYIGETEKNLDLLFERAEEKQWILFFDEADALFGKRTEVKDSHDRYANTEVSYLIQRIEDYEGLVILSTNLKSNIDEAFTRRFNSIIYFPAPTHVERRRIWELGLSDNKLAKERIDLDAIAQQYELSPASIIHVAHTIHDAALSNITAAATYNKVIQEIQAENNRVSKQHA